MKKKILTLILFAAIALSLSSCGGNSEKEQGNSDIPSESTQPQNEGQEEEPKDGLMESEEDTGAIKSGTYTLPCGMTIQFFDSVRNDATGNWRRAATSDSYVPADYALEYYNEMFSSDDEIHSIWNATLGTNTRITVSFGMLFVDTLEYVKGEEHDANLMFTGDILDSRIIDIETGEEIVE